MPPRFTHTNTALRDPIAQNILPKTCRRAHSGAAGAVSRYPLLHTEPRQLGSLRRQADAGGLTAAHKRRAVRRQRRAHCVRGKISKH